MGGKRTVLLVYGGFRLLYLLHAVWIYGIRSQSAGGVFCLLMAVDCNTGFDLIGGTVQEVFNLRKDVLEALESAEKGTDVYIKMPEIPSTQATYPQGISEDADCQTNKDLAALFHLNSVRVEYGSK